MNQYRPDPAHRETGRTEPGRILLGTKFLYLNGNVFHREVAVRDSDWPAPGQTPGQIVDAAVLTYGDDADLVVEIRHNDPDGLDGKMTASEVVDYVRAATMAITTHSDPIASAAYLQAMADIRAELTALALYGPRTEGDRD